MNREQSDSYGHKIDPKNFEVENMEASGPVYINKDPSKEPDPSTDEIIYETGEEVEQGYPEGSYQTWNPREGGQFQIDSGVVGHFFPDETVSSPENVTPRDNAGYNTKSGSGW